MAIHKPAIVNNMNEQKLHILTFIISLVIITIANAGNVLADAASKKGKNKNTVNQNVSITKVHAQVEMPAEISRKIQVYDSDFNLVYESIDLSDLRLNDLVLKSDLIIEINNTHIYQFSR